jgi:hypothetical protein
LRSSRARCWSRVITSSAGTHPAADHRAPLAQETFFDIEAIRRRNAPTFEAVDAPAAPTRVTRKGDAAAHPHADREGGDGKPGGAVRSEAMELIGGNGYIEESAMPRLRARRCC